MHLAELTIENFRCFGEKDKAFRLDLRPGLNALVGENDAGKTAVIDALRLALGTTDQEWNRVDADDFNAAASIREIRITCRFDHLALNNLVAFAEYLTYVAGTPTLFIFWSARDLGDGGGRRSGIRIEVRSGKDGKGPTLATEVREFLRATYLRPLRDADRALSAGRGSRLSQILRSTPTVTAEANYDPNADPAKLDVRSLSVLGIGDMANDLLRRQSAIVGARGKINDQLERLVINNDPIASNIAVSGADAAPDTRLRLLLEKLDVALGGHGRRGLGSNNLLFMASELLLLTQEEEGHRLLLIEEPEAHLHTQRQLRVMRSLQDQADDIGIQVIVTTHSPNLASAIDLGNLAIIRKGNAFSLAEGKTALSSGDYQFLERFLDVTKANLFFACGVVIVEGDAENILLPTLARLIGRDFTKYGVSIVNVGGTGLRRYARIFQRKDPKSPQLDIPVACLADLDVMPDCAPDILDLKDSKGRRWRRRADFAAPSTLEAYIAKKEQDAGQWVRIFVSDEWTFEYDLALGPRDVAGKTTAGLAEDVYVAACLAGHEDDLTSGKMAQDVIESKALAEFSELKGSCKPADGCTAEEVLATKVYARFAVNGVSKAIAAQYLADRLEKKAYKPEELRRRMPTYLVNAIDYVTGNAPTPPEQDA